MKTLRLFNTPEEARDYRKEHGTGGWIFSNPALTLLFPPEFTQTTIINHPLTKGHDGRLIGS